MLFEESCALYSLLRVLSLFEGIGSDQPVRRLFDCSDVLVGGIPVHLACQLFETILALHFFE
jgi:hypothetical protein